MQMKSEWRRVTKAKPCVACGKPDWCTVSADGAVAWCGRVESRYRRKDGWLHFSAEPSNAAPRSKDREPERERVIDWNVLNTIYQNSANGQAAIHAKSLGVSESSLTRLGIGWDGEAACFPMRDAAGKIVGIRLRFPDGKKKAVYGSRQGLFFDRVIRLDQLVLICEGPTDTAAAITLGFEAIGRPSCSGGIASLVKLCVNVRVVIVSDDDTPGLRGARELAKELPGAKVFVPPTKDFRLWQNSGVSRADVDSAIEASCF